ncbi:hypothetical protein ACLBXX_16135 [Microbacterium sp. C23T]
MIESKTRLTSQVLTLLITLGAVGLGSSWILPDMTRPRPHVPHTVGVLEYQVPAVPYCSASTGCVSYSPPDD